MSTLARAPRACYLPLVHIHSLTTCAALVQVLDGRAARERTCCNQLQCLVILLLLLLSLCHLGYVEKPRDHHCLLHYETRNAMENVGGRDIEKERVVCC